MAVQKEVVEMIVKAVSKGFENVQGDLKKAGSEASKASKGMLALGAAAGAAAIGGVLMLGREMLQFSEASIQVASDLVEIQSKFDTVFGPSADEVTTKLEEFADAANRSVIDLKEMGSSVQDTFVPLGFARDKAAELSVELTQLAVDVASFNNAAEPEVMKAFQSAIVGNHETVRQFGIVITQAALDAELLTMGLTGGAKAASEQEKVMARLNLIMKGTTDAQGDAIKTADSYENVTKGLDAAIKDLSASFGALLIPSAKEAKKHLVELTKAATDFIDKQATWNKLVEQANRAVELGLLSQEEYLDVVIRQTHSLDDYNIVVDESGQVIDEFQQRINEIVDAQENAIQSTEDHAAGLQIQAEAIVATAETMAILKTALDAGIISQTEYEVSVLKTRDGITVETEEIESQIKTMELNQTAAETLAANHERLSEASNAAKEAAIGQSLANQSLAESLKSASQADIARTAIGLLKDEIEKTGDPTGNLTAAMIDISDEFGITDDKSRALADNMPALIDLWGTAAIKSEDAADSLRGFNKDAQDGEVDMRNLNDTFGIIPTTFEDVSHASAGLVEDLTGDKDNMIESVEDLDKAWDDGTTNIERDMIGMSLVVDPRFEETETRVLDLMDAVDLLAGSFLNLQTIGQSLTLGDFDVPDIPTHPGQGGLGEPAFSGFIIPPSKGDGAFGLDFVVPGGHTDDSFGPFFFKTGEHVTAVPGGGQPNGNGGGMNAALIQQLANQLSKFPTAREIGRETARSMESGILQLMASV